MKYAVFYEPTPTRYSAHVPDLPGYVAAAATLDETRELMREAIEGHWNACGSSVPTIRAITGAARKTDAVRML